MLGSTNYNLLSSQMSDIRSVLAHVVGNSVRDKLSQYTSEVQTTEFLILSDYVIDDPIKPNSVAAFTIAPMRIVSEQFDAMIRHALPSDIKGAKSVSDAGLELLTRKDFLHISFILQDLSVIGSIESSRLAVDQTLAAVSFWITNQPEGKEKFSEQHLRFQKYRRELDRRNPNITLFRQIALVANIAAYLAFLLSQVGNATKIAWVPDRDKITDAYDSIAFDIFEMNHFGICDEVDIDGDKVQILFGVPDADSRHQWFDRLVRLPDYIAGSLASFNLQGSSDISAKHGDVLDNVIANNPNCFVFQATSKEGALDICQLLATRVNP